MDYRKWYVKLMWIIIGAVVTVIIIPALRDVAWATITSHGNDSVNSMIAVSTPVPTPIPRPTTNASNTLSGTPSPLDFPFARWVWFWWALLSAIVAICLLIYMRESVDGVYVIWFVFLILVGLCLFIVCFIDCLIRFVFDNSVAGYVVSMIILTLGTIISIGVAISKLTEKKREPSSSYPPYWG